MAISLVGMPMPRKQPQLTPEILERIDAARAAQGDQSLRDIALRAGCTSSTVHNWTRGLPMSARMLAAITDASGATGRVRARVFRAWRFVDPGPRSAYDGREYWALRMRYLRAKHGEEKVGLFSPSHAVQADTPPEVIDEWLARFEEDIERG